MSWDIWLEVETKDGEFVKASDDGVNYTHNTNNMLRYIGFLNESWSEWDNTPVSLFMPIVSDAIQLLKDNPHLESMNPENGWGSYGTLIEALERVLEMCQKAPKGAIVKVWC